MKVRFETETGRGTYVNPREAFNTPDSKGYIWLKTTDGDIKKADMVQS